MPELPEIASLAAQMNNELSGKVIANLEVLQEKSLNLPLEEISKNIISSTIEEVTYHGKWLFMSTTGGWILLNLGMGGEVLLVSRQTMPEKFRIAMDFEDGTCLAINFWWFGYFHFSLKDHLQKHQMTARLGPNALDIKESNFQQLFKNQKGKVKAFLLDQSKIAGIGNAYIHDILFLAGIHPLRAMNSLSQEEIRSLFIAIHKGLESSLSKKGAFYEKDLHGNPGGFSRNDILVGYNEDKPCPACGTIIQKIKTGSTSSYICPVCQPG